MSSSHVWFGALVGAATLSLVSAQPADAPPAEQASTQPSTEPVRRLAMLTLSGEMGTEISARGFAGLEPVLEKAKITDLLVVLDTPGGFAESGKRIGQLVHESKVNVHVVVRNAISAGVWMVAAADTILVVPGAALGGAVIYHIDDSKPDSAPVYSKMNSIASAELAATAESHGHNGLLFKAMVLPEVEVYQIDGEPDVSLRDTKPAQGRYATIDGPDTVLTLTYAQAVSLKLAKPVASPTIAEVAAALGFTQYETPPAKLDAVMTKAKSEILKIQKRKAQRLDRLAKTQERLLSDLDQLLQLVEVARDRDPDNLTVYYKENSGFLTPASQVEWRNRRTESLGNWQRVLDAAGKLDVLRRDEKQDRKDVVAMDTALQKFEFGESPQAAPEPASTDELADRLSEFKREAERRLKYLRANDTLYRIENR